MAMNKHRAYIYIRGKIGIANTSKPILMKSNNEVYQINIENPDFSANNMQDPAIAQAIEGLKTRIKTSNEYPTPSIFLSVPAQDMSGKVNKVHYWDIPTKKEFQATKDPAAGQDVIVGVSTYDSDSNLNAQYGGRAQRLIDIMFPDKNKIEWYVPADHSPLEMQGFQSLDDQGIPAAPQAPANNQTQAPAFNNSTPAANPFGQPTTNTQQSTNAQTMPANSQYKQQSNVTPSTTNPLLNNASNTQPQSPFGQQTNAQPQGQQPNAFGQQTNAQPQGQQANAFGQQANAQPQGQSQNPFGQQANTQPQGQQPNAFGQQANAQSQGQQPNPFGQQANSQPQGQQPNDPFAGTGNTVDISDDDLPF